MHARRALRCQLTDESTDAADEEALEMLSSEEAALEQEVLDLNRQLRQVKAVPAGRVNDSEQGHHPHEGTCAASRNSRARSYYALMKARGPHHTEDMYMDSEVEQEEEEDEEEDLSREEYFTPSSMSLSVRTLGSRASSRQAVETPYFSAAPTAATYRAISRKFAEEGDGGFDMAAMDTSNDEKWSVNDVCHDTDGMDLREPPLKVCAKHGSSHDRSRSRKKYRDSEGEEKEKRDGVRGEEAAWAMTHAPVDLNPSPPCSPVGQCEERQLVAENFQMPEPIQELPNSHSEQVAAAIGQQQKTHTEADEGDSAAGQEQSTLYTSRSHYTPDHSAMLSARSNNTTDNSAMLSSRSHNVAIPSSHVEWRPSSKSFIGMIRKNRLSSSGAEAFNSPERTSGGIILSKHSLQSPRQHGSDGIATEVVRGSVNVAKQPQPNVPVDVKYDAFQDAYTQMRTSLNYYSPPPQQQHEQKDDQKLKEEEVVPTQQVIVMPCGMEIPAKGSDIAGKEDLKSGITKETLAVMDESLVSKILHDMAEKREAGNREARGQSKTKVGTDDSVCAVQEQLERVVSNVCSRVSCAEEVLLDQLRAKFEEAVDGLLSNLAWEGGSIRDVLGPEDIQRWITVAIRPSEATVRDRFQSLQRECVESLQTVKRCAGSEDCSSASPLPLSCSCALRAAALVPGCKVSEVQDPEETWLAVKSALAELRPVGVGSAGDAQHASAPSSTSQVVEPPQYTPSVELGIDIQRLDVLDEHVGQLQSILAVAVAELELSASDAKMLEARTVAAQASAASAEQRAKLAERERNELSEQLSMARELINSRENAPTRRPSDGSPTGAEARAARAEKAAAEATAKSERLQREMTILRLQTRIAVEQLRAFGGAVDGMTVDIGSQDAISSQGSPVRDGAQSAASANSPGAASRSSRSSLKSAKRKTSNRQPVAVGWA